MHCYDITQCTLSNNEPLDFYLYLQKSQIRQVIKVVSGNTEYAIVVQTAVGIK